ncbi:MAG: DegT/DnrJ/EryC1/StrS family aminotransferase [Syntrophaceae bacterium]|nr:DegT/DnrJ/EryC1/StrS family aminotransferase [Syntrophaceae bacterium]
MEFIDLASQQKRIREKIDRGIAAVLNHGQYIMGPEIAAIETELARYTGVKHAISCASGTDALLMALMARGIGPGDAVLTTPFTFIATAEVISLLGATPVFVDIDPKTYNIDPDLLERCLAALRGRDAGLYPLPRTEGLETLSPRAVIAVDLFGLPADYGRLEDIAKRNGLFLIEDACQSFGAELNGRKACAFGDVGCTSFFPAKPLGCYGDGGMCFCDDAGLAEIMRSIRLHGKGDHKYENVRIGINGRMDTIQAAVLLAKFSIFEEEVGLRQAVASRYTESLRLCGELVTPYVPAGYQSVWAQYSLLARDEARRDAIMKKMQAAGIPTVIYYPRPLHLQGAFAFLGYQAGDFPASEDCARRIFSLPMHPYLGEADQDRIVAALLAAAGT